MATGKYLSLEEARKKGLLDRFCKEHQTTGNKRQFTDLLDAMAKTPSKAGQTSTRKHRGAD